ncbi:hypothetical protein [Streptomyces monomycini]|uniref:hypothetical protein n=1 Tax=Streptomyces monomycini TaxID=371720 RepID=UPI001EEB20CA|nr:hypothetical protein [Streptomyces monomycini]
MQLQQRLLESLEPSHPAEQDSCNYSDIRLVALLITASWPHASPLVSPELASSVPAYAQSQPDLPRKKGRPSSRHHFASPPEDAAACAGLLQAAARILDSSDIRDELRELTEAADWTSSRASWQRELMRQEENCSPRIREALKPPSPFTRVSGIITSNASGRQGYTPENVPAFLKDEWCHAFLSKLGGTSHKYVRKVAAICLVQLAAGNSPAEAAKFLGINQAAESAVNWDKIHDWQDTQKLPRGFRKSLTGLAEMLSSTKGLIDYQERRGALQNWEISETTWEELTARLPTTRGRQPTINARKRQDASVFVWTQVTQGEHLFAPRPIEARQPREIQRDWARRRNTTWYQLTRPDAMSHYAKLRRVLTEYAEQVARDIDSSAGQIINTPKLTHSEHPRP